MFNLDKTYYNQGTLKIINYELLDTEKYTYKKCLNENDCQEYTKDIIPGSSNKLLKIEYDFSLNKNIFNYLNIEETKDNIKNITPNNYYENTVLFEVPNNISIDNLTLLFNVRNTVFRVKK